MLKKYYNSCSEITFFFIFINGLLIVLYRKHCKLEDKIDKNAKTGV